MRAVEKLPHGTPNAGEIGSVVSLPLRRERVRKRLKGLKLRVLQRKYPGDNGTEASGPDRIGVRVTQCERKEAAGREIVRGMVRR